LRLEKVIHRKPVPFRPYESAPNYLLCYVVETLACGHTLTTYPPADPLVAARRQCKECGAKVLGANLVEFRAAKKKPQKVSMPARSSRAA